MTYRQSSELLLQLAGPNAQAASDELFANLAHTGATPLRIQDAATAVTRGAGIDVLNAGVAIVSLLVNLPSAWLAIHELTKRRSEAVASVSTLLESITRVETKYGVVVTVTLSSSNESARAHELTVEELIELLEKSEQK